MKTIGITKLHNTFKGFYRGKVQVSRIFSLQEGFSFANSNIFMSFHNLGTGEILQTKPMRSYLKDQEPAKNKIDLNLFFTATGYFVLEFHNMDENDELGFIASL